MPSNARTHIEHRRDERYNLAPPWRALIRFGEVNLEALLVDLSKGGIKLRLSRSSMSTAIQQGYEINFTIFLIVFLPSGKESRFNASIRWVQRLDETYILGLQYIDPVGKTLIFEMVDELLEKLQQ